MKNFEKKSTGSLKRAVYAISIFGLTTLGFPNFALSNNNEIRRIEGAELTELSIGDLEHASGECVKNKDMSGNCDLDLYLTTWWKRIDGRPKKYIFVIRERLGLDTSGQLTFRNQDAIEYLPSGKYRAFSSDQNCVSLAHPQQSVLAIGLWTWRKKPKIGGYAHSIKNAWVIDYASKKFQQVSTKSVKCEINDDRD